MSDHASPNDDASFQPPSLEELSALLPQFEMKDFLAQGGMGAVYLARQISLDRLVAIKVLPPAWGAEAGYAELFQREAKAMAKLHHNHIVGVFDFGITTGGHLYLVMEYVSGHTLHELIRLHKLPTAKVQGLALQLCDGLAYAHEHGVLHRDIKPGNVLVSSGDEVKIADFGLARHAGAAVEEQSLGTPDYAAPELFTEGAMVDHRADIFALGIVLQEMLTGKVPGRPREPLAGHGTYDPGWEPLIAKATHANPVHRFRTVREMREAVANVAKRVAKPAPAPGAAPRPRIPASAPEPEPSSFPWIAVIAGVIVAAVVGVWWMRNRPQPAPQLPAPVSVNVATTPATSPNTAPVIPEGPSTGTPPGRESPKSPVVSKSPKAPLPYKPGPALTLAAVPPGHVFKLREGHKDVVYDVAVFPDQRHAASASADGTVAVWDLQSGNRIRSFGPVPGAVYRVAVSPDGRFVAAGGNDYKAYVWSVDAPEAAPKELPTTARSVAHLNFSPDGASLLVGASDVSQGLIVWDWKKSSSEVVPGFRSTPTGLEFAPGINAGAFVAIGQRVDPAGMVMELWLGDLARRSLVRQLGTPALTIIRTKITPDGRRGVGYAAGRVVCWDLESGRLLAQSDRMSGIAGDLEFLDNGRLVLFASLDRSLHIFETVTGKDVWTSAPAETQCTNSSAVVSGGRYVVTAGGWRFGTGMEKDGDYALHVWALPDLSTLKSEAAGNAIAAQQMLTLDKDDPELWALLVRLAAEWQEKSAASPDAARKELDEKYLGAVRREMSSASPRDREAYLSEISRVANASGGALPPGSPSSLVRLHDIYQQQVTLLPQKLASARSELGAAQMAQLEALEKKRADAKNAAGAARVQTVKRALTELKGEMVLAKLQEHFLPKVAAPTEPQVPTFTTSNSTSTVAGPPVPQATGDIPAFTTPMRGLVRPSPLHRVEVWPRNNSGRSTQIGLSKVPANLGPVVAIAVGDRHALALKPDGTVVQWGNEDNRILGVPSGVDRIVAIAAGPSVSACLRFDGAVIAWNSRQMLAQRTGQPPAVGVSPTSNYVIARHQDGSVSFMGPTPTSTNSSYTPPQGLTGCAQVCAVSNTTIALMKDGTVMGWGRPQNAGSYVASENMPKAELIDGVSIAANNDLAFLLKRSGEIVAWGQNVPADFNPRPRFPGATRLVPGRPTTGLAIGLEPGVWKFLSFSDNRYPIDVETAEARARGCTDIGIGTYFIVGLRPL